VARRSELLAVAEAVARSAAGMLEADVRVAAADGRVLASAARPATSPPRTAQDAEPHLTVPFEVGGRRYEVIVQTGSGAPGRSPETERAVVELLINQLLSTARVQQESDRQDAFLRGLLTLSRSEAYLLHEAEDLDIDLSGPRLVVLIDALDCLNTPGRDPVSVRDSAHEMLASVDTFMEGAGTLFAGFLGKGELALLVSCRRQDLSPWWSAGSSGAADAPAARSPVPAALAPNSNDSRLQAVCTMSGELARRLSQEHGCRIVVGVGRLHQGLAGLALSYRDALAAMKAGRVAGWPEPVYPFGLMGLAVLGGPVPLRHKLDFSTQLLRPLDEAPDLLHTLEVLFEVDGSPSLASTRLAIHRNTLTYRLDKVSSLTSYDPRNFDAAVQLRLALYLRGAAQAGAMRLHPEGDDLSGEPSPLPGAPGQTAP
jgi:carbohydrate diacid regulator